MSFCVKFHEDLCIIAHTRVVNVRTRDITAGYSALLLPLKSCLNQLPLPSLSCHNQAPLPVLSGRNQAPLSVIFAKEAQAFQILQFN